MSTFSNLITPTGVLTATNTQTVTNKTINLANNTLVSTSAQLAAAVTDETGTGALVFATSPTLVTPALGTPSSGVVTNLTGTANITATGGASGPIAATTLSASSTVSGAGFSAYLASPPAIGGTAPAAASFTSLNTGQLAGLRNRIINGAMTIDQRNGGASVANVAAAAQYTLDRWWIYGTLASKFTCQQASATLPSGFANYLAITSSAATTPAATDIYVFGTKPEGFNIADFAWGTANAKSVTLSFRVYSSLTGTFGGSIGNSAANRCYVFSYSIPVANTWTTISVTIPGDTSGTWLVNNGIGAQMYFDLGSGTSQKTTAGTWGGTFYYGVTGGVNVVATNAATFYITGVQLELGSVATPFEQRPYGMELALCQRYYYKIANTSGNRYYSGSVSAASTTRIISSVFAVAAPLRISPAITYSGIDIYNSSYSSVGAITSASVYAGGTSQTPSLDINLASGLTTGSQYIVTIAPTTGYIDFSAEL